MSMKVSGVPQIAIDHHGSKGSQTVEVYVRDHNSDTQAKSVQSSCTLLTPVDNASLDAADWSSGRSVASSWSGQHHEGEGNANHLSAPRRSSSHDASKRLPADAANCSDTSNDCHSSDGSSSQRWSDATRKVKSLVSVTNTFVEQRKRSRARNASFKDKNIFLEKFSTRDIVGERGAARKSTNDAPPFAESKQLDLSNSASPSSQKEDLQDQKNVTGETKTESAGSPPASDNTLERSNLLGRIINLLFEPYSNFIQIWAWTLIAAIQYNCWFIIFRTSFPEAQASYRTLWFCLDCLVDLIYLLDVLICSRTTFLENGIYQNNLKTVSCRYMKSKEFLIDVASLLPTDLLGLFITYLPIYRISRLLKFLRLFHAKNVVESTSNCPEVVRGLFWLHFMFLLMHWNGCIYFIISRYEGFGSNAWVYPKPVGVHESLSHRYVRCIYWSTLILTTIGESAGPDTTLECLYMVCCYITGIFIFAAIVGQAGNTIEHMTASRVAFERQRDNTMQYMKLHDVPSHLQTRVRLWYDYTYSRGRFNGELDINEVKMLPDKMKTELALHVHLETLRKVSFLQKCQPEFLHALVLKMKLHIFTPGDFICRKGEIAREMYVMSDGVAEVVSDTGRILKVLVAGDFFGEIGVLSLSAGQNRRTADVRTCGYVELFVLSKDDVMSATADYPEAQKILSRYGRRRLALGKKDGPGPRDHSTSGSDSENVGDKIQEQGKTRSTSSVAAETKCDEKLDLRFHGSGPKTIGTCTTPKGLSKSNSTQSICNARHPGCASRESVIVPASHMQYSSLSPLNGHVEGQKETFFSQSAQDQDSQAIDAKLDAVARSERRKTAQVPDRLHSGNSKWGLLRRCKGTEENNRDSLCQPKEALLDTTVSPGENLMDSANCRKRKSSIYQGSFLEAVSVLYYQDLQQNHEVISDLRADVERLKIRAEELQNAIQERNEQLEVANMLIQTLQSNMKRKDAEETACSNSRCRHQSNIDLDEDDPCRDLLASHDFATNGMEAAR